jgi:excinuclease UvrABC ATPase subunit
MRLEMGTQMTQGTEFRKAQAEALANRTACWICKNYFDRKAGEMSYLLAYVFVGKVGTIGERTDEITAEGFYKVTDNRKPVFERQSHLVCNLCEENHVLAYAVENIYPNGGYHSDREATDLLWDEA